MSPSGGHGAACSLVPAWRSSGFWAREPPPESELAGWIAAGLLLAAGLLAAYATLLRADLTMIPIALGSMMAIGGLMRGAERAFPGALPGALAAALLTAGLAWWLFRTLRRGRQES